MSLHLASNRYFKTMPVLTRQKRVCVFYISQILWEKKIKLSKVFDLNFFRGFIESIYIYSFSQHFPQKVWQ